ncbi:MAG: CAP domain-containing protein [Elusimicrobiota bacterium]|jgi:uncharacterized protein YkwD|nr:CAP domain-containing protein [Elusimicrobiota bacterium]
MVEKSIRIMMCIALFALFLNFAANVANAADIAGVKYKPNIEAVKDKMIEQLNELRKLNGLNPLSKDNTAQKVAQKRANFQKNNTLTHDGLQDALKEIKNSNYGTENLATQWEQNFNSDDEFAKALIVQWFVDEGIENKGHHKQMLNPYYDITGVGVKQESNGMVYVSMVYASTTTMPVTKEIADNINKFYEYFNSNELNKAVPLPQTDEIINKLKN